MSYTSGFFDAVDQGGGDYDRVYSAADFSHYFSLLVKNGVFPDPSTGLQVVASSAPDMHVAVKAGSGWINGYYLTIPEGDSELLTVPTANPSLSRIDSVIMGLNYTEREIQIYVKSGSVSSSPSPVSLQRDNDLYELELARITLQAGSASITQSMITDARTDSSRCGIVTGTVENIDTTDLFAQYDDAFQTWFKDIQTQLEGDVATNLLNRVNQIQETVDKTVEEIPKLVGLTVNPGWAKLKEYTVAGSYEWDVPDIFGDGKPYLIGVVVIGAGGSGACIANSYTGTSSSLAAAASGGASGQLIYFTVYVTPGEKKAIVVGQCGVAKSGTVNPSSSSYLSKQDGANGGSSSFDGKTASGGEGGHSASGAANGAYSKGQSSSVASDDFTPDGGFGGCYVQVYFRNQDYALVRDSDLKTITDCFDPFALRRMLCSGGGAYAAKYRTDDAVTKQGTAGKDPLRTEYRGGDGAAKVSTSPTSVYAKNANGPGNGGGGVAACFILSSGSGSVTSGKGSDGAVYIYVLGKAVS